MAHRRSHAVLDSQLLVGENEAPSPSCRSPEPSSSSKSPSSPTQPRSAFQSRTNKRGLRLDLSGDSFIFNWDDADTTKCGEPMKREMPRPCSSVTDDPCTLMRNMSISITRSITPTKSLASPVADPGVPLFLMPSRETPAILASEYRIVGILGK